MRSALTARRFGAFSAFDQPGDALLQRNYHQRQQPDQPQFNHYICQRQGLSSAVLAEVTCAQAA